MPKSFQYPNGLGGKLSGRVRELLMRAISFLAVLSLVFGWTAFCAADEASMGAVFKQFMSAPDSPVILRGDYLKASMVAYQDFAKHLVRVTSEAHSKTTNDRVLSDQLSKLENYDISVDQTPTSYIVQFGPTVRNSAHVVFGGGMRYIIDRNTFAIADKVGLK
jgi:hypothetical protein